MAIELPTTKIKAESITPKTILFYSKPKQGKTTVLSLLENSLIIDTESGSRMVDACKIQVDITKPVEEQAKEFVDICRAIYMKGYNVDTKVYTPFYKYIIVDTFTRLDEWSETQGTIQYMDKAQGKKFNRDAKGNKIPSTSPEFESVHEIGQGFGYKHSREVMLNWYDKICMLAPVTIFVCHVKDKLLSTNLTDAVLTREISLTGKVKDIISSKVDTIMYGFRDGTRCPYLSGKTLLLTESNDKGEIITNNWNQIFLD